MQRIEEHIRELAAEGIRALWNADVDEKDIQIQKTRRDFEGDFTIVVFPLLRISRQKPEQTGEALGEWLQEKSEYLDSYNVIKGFLNLVISTGFWRSLLESDLVDPNYGKQVRAGDGEKIMIEYSSPNTNKPLHLGHIRNILLGHSVSGILKAAGKEVMQVNLVNDRGIHICKSMLAWKRDGGSETPENSGMKGDHLVGKYYVRFDQMHKQEARDLEEKGMDKEKASQSTAVLSEAREMLRAWEADDPEVRKLWESMNAWVYAGFDETYRRLGISFDKTYYESDTYKLGRSLVLEGLQKGVLYKKEDGSVWADLEDEGLDQKLLLRSDGTSVYMTQDVGTANQRYEEYPFDKHIYVVGNEQNYHFQVLSLVLKKLGFDWSDRLYHLSYGMVELPEGKMKSREGTVVDADDLMDEMENTARQMSEELGKLDGYSDAEKKEIYRKVGMGALKYFILKVDPRKNMTFDPRESVDFNGNTGPFIQYTYARIQSVLRKGGDGGALPPGSLSEKELALVSLLYAYPDIIREAADNYSPAAIANYLYDLAKEFNQFYHDHSILNAEEPVLVAQRLRLARATAQVIESGMELLGIEVPERM